MFEVGNSIPAVEAHDRYVKQPKNNVKKQLLAIEALRTCLGRSDRQIVLISKRFKVRICVGDIDATHVKAATPTRTNMIFYLIRVGSSYFQEMRLQPRLGVRRVGGSQRDRSPFFTGIQTVWVL